MKCVTFVMEFNAKLIINPSSLVCRVLRRIQLKVVSVPILYIIALNDLTRIATFVQVENLNNKH